MGQPGDQNAFYYPGYIQLPKGCFYRFCNMTGRTFKHRDGAVPGHSMSYRKRSF